MRSICMSLVLMITATSLFAQASYDTTYSNEWDSKTESWVNYDRIISCFSDGVINSELIQIYDNQKWENYNLKSYYYMDGKIIEEHEMYWNDLRLEWEGNYRKLFSYDNNQLLKTVTHQYIFNGVYVNASREIFKYDENSMLIEKVVEKYEEAWTNFLKYQYYYNANDLIIEENLTYWNYDNSWGEVSFALNHIYDQDGQIISKVKSQLKEGKKTCLAQEIFNYDIDGKLIGQVTSQWNNRKKTWINKNRAEYVNDMDGYIISMLNQTKDKKEWLNYLFTDFRGDNKPITGLDIADGMTFSVYPAYAGKRTLIEFNNPYNEFYYVRVINQNGELIGSATTKDNEVSIDARNMIKGLYFVELQGRNLYSGKFSIE